MLIENKTMNISHSISYFNVMGLFDVEYTCASAFCNNQQVDILIDEDMKIHQIRIISEGKTIFEGDAIFRSPVFLEVSQSYMCSYIFSSDDLLKGVVNEFYR